MRLLLTNCSSVNSQDAEDITPLHRAAQGGFLDTVKLLAMSGADLIIHDSNDMTPLDLAINNDRLDVARYLADRMGSADAQNRIINLASGHTASQNSLPGVGMPSFGHGIDPNIPYEMRPSLHAASMTGQLEIVRSLLESGADVNERDKDFGTSLLSASQEGRLEVVQLLIEFGADVNTPDRIGWTPLQIASRHGHIDVIRLLLNHGAHVNAKKQNQWTPLHLAMLSNAESFFEIVEALLQRPDTISDGITERR